MPKLSAAEALFDLNFNVMPLWLGTKIPKEDWKPLQIERMTKADLARAFWGRDWNLAIICGELRETGVNVLGLDFDDAETFERHSDFPESPMVAKTKRGFHAYYRLLFGQLVPNSVGIHGEKLDARNQGGFLVPPPSFNRETGFTYEWLKGPVDARDLPLFPLDLIEEEKPEITPPLISISSPNLQQGREEVIRVARAYIAKIEAVSGQNGHASCFRAACKLRDRGCTPEEAWMLLVEWNQKNAIPPFSEKELLHKHADVFGRRDA